MSYNFIFICMESASTPMMPMYCEVRYGTLLYNPYILVHMKPAWRSCKWTVTKSKRQKEVVICRRSYKNGGKIVGTYLVQDGAFTLPIVQE
ncbi:hypothetical protein [Jeotgalibacillus marinus]|uniref:Uncharacterized protein n=1 Tax=Jeotgalibacillus marinus TaxID=86667 RepID=A0ABV3PZJ3_9BACL